MSTDASELNRIRREVGTLMHDLLVHLTQQDGRPVTQHTLRAIRDYGLACYLHGQHESRHGVTMPAPAFPPAEDT